MTAWTLGSGRSSPRRWAVTRSGTRSARVRNGRSASSTRTSPPSTSGDAGASLRRSVRSPSGPPVELEGEARARASAGDVVVEVGVEALEPRVEIRGERDSRISRSRPSRPNEVFRRRSRMSAPAASAASASSLDPRHQRVELGQRPGIDARACPEQGVDLRLGDVQPTEPVTGIRVGRPPALDCRPDACLDADQPAEQVAERCVGFDWPGARSGAARRHGVDGIDRSSPPR